MSPPLLLPKMAAERLGVSTKTLNGYVRGGELRYIDVGGGGVKQRRRYTEDDLDDFVNRRAKRNVPCQSTSTKTVRSTTSTSNSKVIGFMALRDARTSAKLKPLSRPNESVQNSRQK